MPRRRWRRAYPRQHEMSQIDGRQQIRLQKAPRGGSALDRIVRRPSAENACIRNKQVDGAARAVSSRRLESLSVSDWSTHSTRQVAPFARQETATSSSRSRFRASKVRLRPGMARARANAAPIPQDAPVMTIVLKSIPRQRPAMALTNEEPASIFGSSSATASTAA